MTPGTDQWDEAGWYGMEVSATLSTERPDLDVVYAGGPDFDPTRLLVEDYIGGPLAIRGRAMPQLAVFMQGPPYRLLLNALLAGFEIGRIDGDRAQKPGIPVLPELLPLLARLAPDCDAVPGLMPGTVELRRRFTDPPPVTVLHRGCLLDIGFTDWPASQLHVKRYDTGLDSAWRLAETDYLVLLAPGVQPIGSGWLRALMTLAVGDMAGLACATPGGTVQHETLVPPFKAIATRRSLLAELGGFDRHYSDEMAFADVCLRMRQVGLKVTATPHCLLTAPTGGGLTLGDLAGLRLRWPAMLPPPREGLHLEPYPSI